MKRLITLCLALVLALSLTACGQAKPQSAEIFAMDTIMDFTVTSGDAEPLLSEAQKQIYRLENLLSRTREDSDVSRINLGGIQPVDVSQETADLLQKAVDYSALTDGAFDVTIAPVMSAWGFTKDEQRVPSQTELDALLPTVDSGQIILNGPTVTLGSGQLIDLGGIAKGYASDRMAALYQQYNAAGFVSLGGNVWVSAAKPDGSPWSVAIQDPNNSAGYLGILHLSDTFSVTSGGYQRNFTQNGKTYHHIIDPQTGYPADNGLISVTIISSQSGTLCDALSTAMFVMGEEEATDFWRSGVCTFEMVLVTDDGRVLLTPGVADHFESSEDNDYVYETIN